MTRVLIVCAHQDDEAFIASRMRWHLLQGDILRVVFTTLSFFNGPKYKERRRIECLNALMLLGLDRADFLGFPDGESWKHLPDLIHKIKEIIADFNPAIAYVTAYEGGHIDHDVACFCLSKATENAGIELFEFPLYSGYRRGILPFKLRSFPPRLQTTVVRLPKEELLFVKRYWECYGSQFFRFLMYVHLTCGFRKAFGFEFFRLMPLHNFHIPSPSGVAYEKYLPVRFQDFSSAVLQLESGINNQPESQAIS